MIETDFEDMKKIGIITHYLNSENYGGNLQAYALCAYLNRQGYQAEQISYLFRPEDIPSNCGENREPWGRKMMELIKKLPRLPIAVLKQLEEKKNHVSERRTAAFRYFNQQLIPHGKKVYTQSNIAECVGEYGAFITGSDQVWNLKWYHPAFFLDFAPSDKIKLSYAASLAVSNLTQEQKAIFRASLRDYTAVSVREKEAVALLSELSPVPIHHVIDPTLLLSRREWDGVCGERRIEDAYLFCYFLGNNRAAKKSAKEFARKKGLCLVNLAHAGGVLKGDDLFFGDERLFDVSPEVFLSLIKYADYVFTDSFHALVFSHIYQKQYFVFNRSADGAMNSRIIDLTALFGTEERFCGSAARESLKYLYSLREIDYSLASPALELCRKSSAEFLEQSLGDMKNEK